MAAHKLYAVADIEALEATIKAQAATIANLRARVSELTASSIPPSINGTDRVLARELMRGPMTRAELAAATRMTPRHIHLRLSVMLAAGQITRSRPEKRTTRGPKEFVYILAKKDQS